MDSRDVWLLHLYDGGDDDRSSHLAEATGEAEAMREMKFLLDARPKMAPDARTVRAVLAAARGEAVPRRDRPPARRSRTIGLRVGAASALVALLIGLVGILRPDVLSPDAPPVDPSPTPASESAASSGGGTASSGDASPALSSESARSQRVPAAGRPWWEADPRRGNRFAAGLEDASSYRALGWDDRGDVINLHQRIEMIRTGVDRGWEAPPVPLEMLPGGQDAGGMIPAGRRR